MPAPRSTRAPIIRCRDRVVAAGRVRLGTIIGAGVFDIAPSRRFYSGGGGSVRGYGYQQLGPKDMDGDPIGGRGLAEFALEARIRLKQFGGNFGIVPFFDGGSLTTEALPDFKDWRFARRPRRALLFELRADPHRRRRAAQPRRRATARSRSPSRSARPSEWPKRRSSPTGAEPPPRRLRRDWPRRLLNELFALFVALLFLLAGALVLLDTRARPPLHRRPHRAARDRVGPAASASAGSTARSSASRSCATSRSPTSSGVFLTSPNIKLDWAPGAWLDNKLYDRQPDRRAGRR